MAGRQELDALEVCARVGAVSGRCLRVAWLALACWVCATPARAAEGSSRFEIPLECGTTELFEAELRARLGALPSPPLTLRIAKSGLDYRLEMRVLDEPRELFAADCRELFQAALVIVVAVVAPGRESPRNAQVAPTEPALGPPEKRAVVAPPRQREQPAPAATPTVRRNYRLALAAGFGAHFGLLPRAGPSFEGALELRFARIWGLSLAGRYFLKSTEQDELTGRGIELDAWGGALRGTLQLPRSLQLRAGVNAYRLGGRALGSASAVYGRTWAAGPAVGVGWAPLQWRRFELSVGTEAHLELLRSRFEVLYYGYIYRVPVLSGAAYLRLSYQFL